MTCLNYSRITYIDKESAIRQSSHLYNELLSPKSTIPGDITLPLHIPYIPSHQISYVTNDMGHYIDIGRSMSIMIMIAMC